MSSTDAAPPSGLRAWSEGIWLAEAPLRFHGVPFGTRMTVVRLADGSLWLHSPIPLTASLRRDLDALGPVRQILSPNKLHHLHLGSARASFPEAELHAPPALAPKRPDLVFSHELGDAPHPVWADTLDQLVVRGSRVMQEVVFLHRSSRTLVVGDLCENFGPHSPPLTRLVARMARMYGRPRMPPDWQWTFRERAATRSSFERLLAWDFDRVILAHGAPLESGAKSVFRREYAWALS